jgi:uncharacterized protein YndB with AHSA1/START domain
VIEKQTIIHEVEYPHPPERLWRALVDSDELAVWLMPNTFAPTPGGEFLVDCESHGLIKGEVLEIDPPRRLSYRWLGSFGDTVVTFDLTPIEGGTRLRLEHRGWRPLDGRDQPAFDAGWQDMLVVGLTRLLARASTDSPM